MTSLLTSYSSVVLNVCQAEAPYASIQAALAEPGLAQPLLMGLAEAPAALRGESSPLHAVEAWQLLGFAGSMVRGLAGLGGTDACNRLLSSSAAPGGPVLMELVRDAVAAMPRSLPPGVPLPSYRMALAALCGTFALLGRSGSSGSARAAPMSDADWAAVEAFSRLWLQLASLCDAGEVMQDALLGMFRLLKGAASSCTPRRLQLAVEAAWVAARQLPLLSAAHAAHPDRGHAGRLAFCLLDPLIACAGQLAAAEPGSEAGGGASAGPEAAEDARDCLQQLHVRLCKAVHAMLVSAPAEEQQAQASLVPAKEMLAELLGKSYDALEAAFDRWERRGGGVAEGGDR